MEPVDEVTEQAKKLEILNLTEKNPLFPSKNINPRFQLFSIRLHVNDAKFKEGKLFGLISVSDKYGLLSDGWLSLDQPDIGYVSLFDRDWCDSVDIINNGFLPLFNPSSRYSVPFSLSIEILMELFVTNEKKDVCFQLCNNQFDIHFSDFWDKKLDSMCDGHAIDGEDGFIQMHYMLLKDAVDTAFEVTFNRHAGGLRVYGLIHAYYGGGFRYECNEHLVDRYKAILYQPISGPFLEPGKIPLMKSVLAVPTKGSLVIEAYLCDYESGKVILDDTIELSSKTEGSSHACIEGTDCSFDVKIDWKYLSYLSC